MGWWVSLALAVLLAGTVAALARAQWQLRRTRQQLRALEARTQPLPPSRTLAAAGRAMKVVAETAQRVRDQGVGGMLMSSIEDLTRWAAEDQAEIRRVAAPDGTVTIVFSDIEDSTALNERLGDVAWVRLLAAHDQVVRSEVTRRGGHVVKSQGDGFMVVFGLPQDAVRAALRIQSGLGASRGRLRRTPIRIRIGMHAGPVVDRDGDYFGRNVAMAARVAAAADGGETLTTDEIRAAVGDDERFVWTDLGDSELKGLAGTHRLWSVRRAPRTKSGEMAVAEAG